MFPEKSLLVDVYRFDCKPCQGIGSVESKEGDGSSDGETDSSSDSATSVEAGSENRGNV